MAHSDCSVNVHLHFSCLYPTLTLEFYFPEKPINVDNIPRVPQVDSCPPGYDNLPPAQSAPDPTGDSAHSEVKKRTPESGGTLLQALEPAACLDFL